MQENVLNNRKYEFLIGDFQKGNQSFNRFAYVYSDSYFENSADKYNPSLSTMSLCLAISTYVYKMFDNGVAIYSNQSKNLKLLLKELGFRKIELNSDFKSEPTLQTIGVATGYKKINLNGKNYTLVPIVIRSCEYGAEWGNNMLAGIRGNHYGFDRAANIAKKFVDKYINKTKEIEGNIKFWIIGYSRGGAVAGLIGKLYNDYCDIYKFNQSFADYNKNISINKDDIYTYTFESPNGLDVKNSRHNGKYLNIHNVVNYNDYVTKVPVRCWGFCRPGVDHRILGGENREEIFRMKRILSKMCFNVFGDVEMEYTADKFRACGFGWLLRDINNQSDFLDCFLKMIANCFFCGQSHDFKKHFGRNMRGLRMAYFRREKAIARLVELCASDENFSKSLAEMFNKRYSNFNLCFKAIFNKPKFLESVRKICDDVFWDYNRKQSQVAPLKRLSEKEMKSLKSVICHMLICFNKVYNYRYFYIFFKNVNHIFSVHEPEICLASLIDKDQNRDIYLKQMKNIIHNFRINQFSE